MIRVGCWLPMPAQSSSMHAAHPPSRCRAEGQRLLHHRAQNAGNLPTTPMAPFFHIPGAFAQSTPRGEPNCLCRTLSPNGHHHHCACAATWHTTLSAIWQISACCVPLEKRPHGLHCSIVPNWWNYLQAIGTDADSTACQHGLAGQSHPHGNASETEGLGEWAPSNPAPEPS